MTLGTAESLAFFSSISFFDSELLVVKLTGYLLNISLTFQPWYLRKKVKDFEVSIAVA